MCLFFCDLGSNQIMMNFTNKTGIFNGRGKKEKDYTNNFSYQ